MQCGDTFRQPDGFKRIRHLWIVITAPLAGTSEAVVVNVSSLRHGADQTVTLAAGEHPFIYKASFINFAAARVVPIDDIVRQVQDGELEANDGPCTVELIKLLQAGIRASPFTPKKILRFLKDNHG